MSKLFGNQSVLSKNNNNMSNLKCKRIKQTTKQITTKE